ncbi:hypothetical protein BS50DRAFT_641625 [Corynespora cassiicola Philippines]|uniref:Rhodopsin domain-containing protein n=1 Tax=Corynespora cassiicola Philippines TaxID=1448308 RepID=A0A2T2MZE8_CORCC|nr:hypothetical protein BS50DRAFT_641625 [Corynespora cassiicola Philippines]
MPIIPDAGDIEAWPTPNYENPETRRRLVFGVGAIMMAVASLFVGMRFYSRKILVKALWIDDFVMLAAAVAAFGAVGLSFASTYLYMGYHIWDLPLSILANPQKALQITMGMQILFVFTTSLIKSSILVSYFRTYNHAVVGYLSAEYSPGVFQDRKTTWFCYGMLVFTASSTVTCIFILLFQCKPMETFWKVTQYANANCLPIDKLAYIPVCISLIFLWPAQYLIKIRITLRQKIIVNVMFLLGFCVFGVDICLLWYVRLVSTESDKTWNSATLYAIIIIENATAMICGSMPACKPLLAELFPVIFAPANSCSRPMIRVEHITVSVQPAALQIPRKAALPEVHHLEYVEVNNWRNGSATDRRAEI